MQCFTVFESRNTSRILMTGLANYSSSSIDHNEKDGGMYILPECIASIKSE